MIDLSGQADRDLSKKPLFIKPIPLAAWIWVIGGIVAIAVRLYLRYLSKN